MKGRPSSSIESIAAAIPKPAELCRLEELLAARRAARDDLAEQARVAADSMTEDNRHQLVPIVRELTDRQQQVEREIAAARKQHSAARAEYAAVVRAVLEPSRKAAQVGLRDAYRNMILSWHALDEIAAALRAAGGAAPDHMPAGRMEPLIRKLLFAAVGDLPAIPELAARNAA